MAKPRGREHTTLTETAAVVVHALKAVPGIKMIAPGEISTSRSNRSGKRFVTVVYTVSGCELIISGQSIQKVSVHFDTPINIIKILVQNKHLRDFTFKERERRPGT